MSEPLQGLSGILFINKPAGMTSHDVVDCVRDKLRMKRIGHAGTLDPMATGLLIILVGQATKLSQYLMGLDKTYVATLKLGETTDSQDADGAVITTLPTDSITPEKVLEVAKTFLGDQYQTPPMFSAKKQGGVALYKLARKGVEVDREARFIRIDWLNILETNLPFVKFEVRCSKGTYVRTIAHDIGQKLGCGAHLTELVRTSIDKYPLTDAIDLEAFENADEATVRKAVRPTYTVIPSRILGTK
jgi:tRNA pseudouridine55 synthase